jgi:hypothetical protein
MAEVIEGTGVLVKEILYSYTPGTPGMIAVVGTPARPSYYATTTERVCKMIPGSEYTATQRFLDSLGSGYLASGESVEFSPGGMVCALVTTRRYVAGTPGTPSTPGVAAVPSQTDRNYQIGWNARAKSIKPLERDGEFSFVVPADAIGAVVGLSGEPETAGYSDIAYGFYVEHGSVYIYERGVEIDTLGFDPDAVLVIRRAAGILSYIVNDEVILTRTAPAGTLWLAAALYSGGDRVTEPVYTELLTASLSGTIGPLTGLVTEGDFTIISATLPALHGSINVKGVTRITGMLKPLRGNLGKPSTGLYAELPRLTGYMESSDLAPTYAIIGGGLLPMSCFMSVLSGSVATIGSSISPMKGLLSDKITASISGSLLALAGSLNDREGRDEGFVIGFMDGSAGMTPYIEVYAILDAAGVITGLLTVTALESALMDAQATATSGSTTQMQITALMQSTARTIVSLLYDESGGEAWVLNADAGGMTRYDNYGFNSFAEIDGRYYGAKSDGIYRLEGADDNGTTIQARVNFGNLSMGSLNRKALPYVYAGVASGGNLVLKVVADDQTYLYSLRENTELLKAHRFEPGRGLRASFYDLELQSDGIAFDLSSIDFQTIELKRRL